MNNKNNQYQNQFKIKLLLAELSELRGNKKIETFFTIIKILIRNKDVIGILESNSFFKEQYLQQEFKESSRFKFDKKHRNTGVPLKESHEKRLKGKVSVKFEKTNLLLSNFVEDKPTLRYFTQNPDQFERWSPERLYNWWLKLRESGILKFEWEIMDAVFFCL